ncbi:MAG TPA: hypothetical protein V6C89_11985 [Drouetiella sp.]|jgi:hypothetical protein
MDDTTNGDDAIAPATRQEQAAELPFFLRAWWLRNFLENEGLVWTKDSGVTSPVWSLHSDPMCDVGSVDQSY